MTNAKPSPAPDPCAEAKKAVQKAVRAQMRARHIGDVRAAKRQLNKAIKKYNGLGCSTKKGK
mgnify:CR=1 FL=1